MVSDGDAEVEGYRRLVRDGRVDGASYRPAPPRPAIALLQELGLPAVTLGRPDIDSPFPALELDDRPGIAAAVATSSSLVTPESPTSGT